MSRQYSDIIQGLQEQVGEHMQREKVYQKTIETLRYEASELVTRSGGYTKRILELEQELRDMRGTTMHPDRAIDQVVDEYADKMGRLISYIEHLERANTRTVRVGAGVEDLL